MLRHSFVDYFGFLAVKLAETRNNTTYAAFTNTQNYSYDALNRLKQADEKPFGYTQGQCDQNPAQCWKQTFTYDRFGNRNFDIANGNTTTIPLGCATTVCNPQVDPATNKLVGYVFDNAGNTKTDANGQTFIYDGENKQVQVSNASGIVGQYFYDGDGKRVKKVVPATGETTVFVYDASGKMVAEYSTVISSAPQVSYLTSDHLGSPRINTDQNGVVIARHDYLPFGEEIARPSYGADSTRQKFTAYERDTESELDFAQARFYNKTHGRFTSVDPYNIIFAAEDAEKEKEGKGQKLFNDYISQPQNWNRYAYVWNNPLRNTDPDGEKVYVVLYTTGNSEGDDEFRRAAETQAENIRNDGQFNAKKDTVLLVGVRTKEDAQNAFDKAAGMEKDFGKVQQVQIFSHAGQAGPVFHPSGTGNEANGVQWTNQEVNNLKINWDSGGKAYFSGCNTANFAQTFANAQNVTAFGYDRYAYFSSSPNSRSGSSSSGPLYLIAADGYSNSIWGAVKNTVGAGSVYPMVRKDPSKRR